VEYKPAHFRLRMPVDAVHYTIQDVAMIYSNGGDGAIDWVTPHSQRRWRMIPPDPLAAEVVMDFDIETPGLWRLGVLVFDGLEAADGLPGNPSAASNEVVVYVDLEPVAPDAPTASGYDHAARQVTLTL
jgi:hypothetical protein